MWAPLETERFTITLDQFSLDELETFARRAFEAEADTTLSVRTLAAIVALLALTTGCSMLQPAASPSNTTEPDPWAGFNNGYEKNEKPASKPEAKSEEKVGKTETTSAALEKSDKADRGDKSDKADKGDKASDDDEEEAKPKKVAKKKPAKKKANSGVATKKPRKRPKKSS